MKMIVGWGLALLVAMFFFIAIEVNVDIDITVDNVKHALIVVSVMSH
ncbi:MAG: hypothetical protein MPK75_04515 [Alphaproteobacteria bacterium]|nr:hypothetical protein [Alphaproteobacteria bacterium]